MNNINKLFREYHNKNRTITYYPFIENINNNIIQKKILEEKYKKLINILSKKKYKSNKINIIETIIGDSIKLEIDHNSDFINTNYYTKTSYLISDNIIMTQYDEIEKDSFPLLNNYNNISNKELTIYQIKKNIIDLVIAKEKDKYIIYFELFNELTEKYYDKINKIIKIVSSKIISS
jgi:hypothetical protein